MRTVVPSDILELLISMCPHEMPSEYVIGVSPDLWQKFLEGCGLPKDGPKQVAKLEYKATDDEGEKSRRTVVLLCPHLRSGSLLIGPLGENEGEVPDGADSYREDNADERSG